MPFPYMETGKLYQIITKNQTRDFEYVADETIDRRRSKRVDVNKKAIINLSGLSVCNCIVKDISITGARILVTNHSWVPNKFYIDGLLPNESILVTQVWKDGGQFGVEFSNITWLSEWIAEQENRTQMQINQNSIFPKIRAVTE